MQRSRLAHANAAMAVASWIVDAGQLPKYPLCEDGLRVTRTGDVLRAVTVTCSRIRPRSFVFVHAPVLDAAVAGALATNLEPFIGDGGRGVVTRSCPSCNQALK